MNKQINEDLDQYKDDFFKGLSFRECAYSVAAITIAGLIIWGINSLGFPITGGVYLSIPIVFPIGIIGFWKSKTNMTFLEYLKSAYAAEKSVPLIYESLEPQFLSSEREMDKMGGMEILPEKSFEGLGKEKKELLSIFIRRKPNEK